MTAIRPTFLHALQLPILLVAGVLLGSCDGPQEPARPITPQPAETGKAAGPTARQFSHQVVRTHAGRSAPAASFTGPDDGHVTLAQFRGRPLLVNLWATWCAPCVAEMPTLDKLAATSGGKLTVIAVAQDLQGAAAVDPWFQKAGLTTLQPYLDPQNHLLDAANSALPTSILYNANGQEVWRVIGAIDWQGAEAKALLAEAGVK